MKKQFLSMAMTLVALSMSAAVITPGQALDRVIGENTPMAVGVSRPKLVATRSIDNQPAVYVFANQDNKGFLVVSADDEATPLLGYGDSESFSADAINPTMQWWLDEYAAEIQYLRAHPERVERLHAPRAQRQAIEPMVKTQWNQSKPFNLMCPQNGTNYCVTGCVATAMAQIVNYHQWPQSTGSGSNSVTYNNKQYTFDFANETFSWSDMLDNYNSTYTTAQANAVAKLMFACGVSVNMSYGTGASGANTAEVAKALVNYFGYDAGASVFYRVYYHLDDWNNLVYNQLVEYGPVQFSGRNAEGGHSFVCDGYDTNDFFHINWGWGGMSDGYFKLTALDPDSQGIGGSSAGYNSSQYIIGNICRPRPGSTPNYSMSLILTLSPSVSQINLGSAFTVTGGYKNTGTTDITFDLGWELKNVDSQSTTMILSKSNTDLPSNYYYDKSTLALPTTTAAGNYTLTPMWRISGTTDWNKFNIPIYDPQYLYVSVSGNRATFTVPEAAKPTVELISVNTPAFIGKNIGFTLSLSNQTENEFVGDIFAALVNSSNTQVASGNTVWIDLQPGQTVETDYTTVFSALSGQTLTPGTYYLLWGDSNGNIVSSAYQLELKAAPTTQGTIQITSFEVVDSNNVNAADIQFKVSAKCTSGYYIGELYAYIFPANGGSSSTRAVSPTLYIDTNQSTATTFGGSFPDLEIGQTYSTYLYQIANNSFTQLTSSPVYFKVGTFSAVETIVPDDDVTVREIYDLRGVRVTSEQPAPGLYIVRDRHADGTVSTTKVLFK